jgi:AraC-like DNA-binding protein
METASPLERYPLIRTHNFEEARSNLSKVAHVESFELLGGNARFSAHLNHLQLRHVGITYCDFDAHAKLAVSNDDFVHIVFWVAGSGAIMIGSNRLVMANRAAIVCPAHTVSELVFDTHRAVAMRFSEPSIRKHLSAILGVRLHAPVQFSMANCDDDNCIAFLRQFAFDVASHGTTPITAVNPLMLEEIEQSLLVGLLCGARHNYSHLLVQDPKAIAPWQVRRAMDYIDANWSKPLTVQALSSAIGVGARSVFKSFRQSAGLSPMEYVKQARLKHAREMLILAETGTTVTGVALACGFQNPGHFAREYKRAFGELPSNTLARARH